jgi:trimeric autotransporter adhesin
MTFTLKQQGVRQNVSAIDNEPRERAATTPTSMWKKPLRALGGLSQNALWDYALLWSVFLAAFAVSSLASAQATPPEKALRGVTAIASGNEHSCAIANGAVWCWGSNSFGQLGSNGSTSPLFNATAVPVPEISQGATAIAVGFGTSCAVVNGGVKCWGVNTSSELGTGKPRNNDPNPVPVSVGVDAGATAVSVGSSHVCAIVNDGVSCWGFNELGKVGNGNFGGFVATPFSVIPANSGVKSISAGEQSTCAVVGSAVKCWGRNKSNEGYLFGNGDPSDDNYNIATDTGFGNDNDVVTLGGATTPFACAYSLTTKKVKCSGRNVQPQGDSKIPVEFNGADYTFEKLVNANGRARSLCGLGVNPNLGTVKCWGAGEDISVNIADAINVASVAVGGSHKCVVTSEGFAKCWGSNTKGQLGAARPIDSSGNSTSAVFVITDGFTVTPVVSGGGGTVFPNTVFTVAAGAAGTIELRPDSASFVVDTVIPTVPADCDAVIAADKKTVAVSRKADTVTNCEVTVAFRSNAVTYTVTSSVDATTLNTGMIVPSGAQTVAAGATSEFRATPNDASAFRNDWSNSTCARDATAPVNPSVFKTQAINADCSVIVKFTPFFTITPRVVKGVNADGAITPNTAVKVDGGATQVFTANAAPGSIINDWSGTCAGTTSADRVTFTTNPISADCTVVATFLASPLPTLTVTASVDSTSPVNSGTVTPLVANVLSGGNTAFTATPASGFVVDAWSGTCGGSDASQVDKTGYITSTITQNCTVIVKFKALPVTKIAVSSAVAFVNGVQGGAISPAGNNAYDPGATATFTATPDNGYAVDTWGGSCGGAANGTSYTTVALTTNCNVFVQFKALSVRSYTAPSPTANAGNITASFTGGDATCTYKNPRYVPVSGGVGSPATPPPAGVQFPYGLFDFTVEQCRNGDTTNFTITYPGPLPTNTRYYKFGPTPTNVTPSWYQIDATVNGNTITFTLQDGNIGDDDLQANGIIVDAGGPGFIADAVPAEVAPIPTLGQWALMLLAVLLAAACAPALLRSTRDTA